MNAETARRVELMKEYSTYPIIVVDNPIVPSILPFGSDKIGTNKPINNEDETD